MKDRRDIEIEIAELELCLWLSKVSKENLAGDNNWSLILTLKSKIEALKWVLNAV